MSSPTRASHRARSALTTAIGLPGLVAVVALLGGCSSSSADDASPSPSSSSAPSSTDTYGALPTFLPTATAAPDRELTGSVAHPALTVEGDSVRADLGRRTTARITVSGPVVPGEGLPNATPAPTCTWTVTVAATGGPVRIRARDFLTEDHLGATYHVAFVLGRPRPPRTLPAGRRTTFELRTVMPAGEGLMRWTPTGRPVALWDFVVEND